MPQTAEDIRRLLAQTMAAEKAGLIDPKVGTALAYIASPLLKAIEVGDLETQIKHLEVNDISNPRRKANDVWLNVYEYWKLIQNFSSMKGG